MSTFSLLCFGIGVVILFVGTITAIITSIVFWLKKNKNLTKALVSIPACIGIGFVILLLSVSGKSTGTDEGTQSSSTSVEASSSTEGSSSEATSSSSEEETTPSVVESTTVEKPEEIPSDKFLAACYKAMGQEVADYAYDILKNQIGFTKLEFKSAVSGTTNYEIYADDVLITVTASEGYCRVFIPNTKYVFYEDGAVKMSAAVFADRMIDSEQQSNYYIMAQEIVKSALKNPSSARFPSIITGEAQIGMQKNGDLVAVSGYVDAKNSFNAKVRSNWTVEFRVTDYNSFACDTVYINIDGEKYGEFIDLN